MDYIAGDYFVVGDDFENADFKSLTDEQIKNILPIINENSVKYSDKQFKDFIKDYENEFLEKLDNESNEHLAEDYKEKDFEC